jgi:hypothetical protein
MHTHFTLMNAVFRENRRVGSLDLDQLRDFVITPDPEGLNITHISPWLS